MPSTPAEWLPILAKQLDDRYPRIVWLRSYASNTPPMPEMGENVRASWVAFQRKACTGYGGLAVDSLGNRIVPNGVRVGDSEDNEIVEQARRIWRDNRLDVTFADVIRDYLTCSIGYLVDGASDGEAVISREIPEQFIAAADPLKPWKARAGLKVWRDSIDGMDYAYVWVPGLRQKFSRKSQLDNKTMITRASAGGWLPGALEPYKGDPPIVILERHAGLGLFEPHIPVIDRINLGKLQRLVVTAMQAYRQRALKVAPTTGGKGGLPEVDDEGNAIDWAKVFEPAPGALWDLPEGIDIWESQQTDIRPLLEGEKTDARDFAAVTRTPISVFIPEGENQSAEGAFNAKEGQINQAKDEIARIQPGLSVAMVYALQIEGVDLGGATVQVTFTRPEHVSITEKYTAAAQARAAGESWVSIARNILGYTPDEIKAEEAEQRRNNVSQLLTTIRPTAPAAEVAEVAAARGEG
jgi:hypothetical protein